MNDRGNILAALAERRWAMLPQALRALAGRLVDVDPEVFGRMQRRAADLKSITAVSVPLKALDGEAVEDLREIQASVESDREAQQGYYVEDGVAVIEIAGTISKQVPWCANWLGLEATSTLGLQQALANVLADPNVQSIYFLVDSPGGTVDGVQEAADAIYEARGRKPMHAQVSDLCCSAAYWLASQADTMSANATATVGSIGVYAVLDDFSGWYAENGVKVNVIASGPYKGTGVEGAPITDEQLAPIQEEIDGLAALFVGAVARGRGMEESAARELASGRTWLATQGRALGLIDEVENSEDALARVISSSGSRSGLNSAGANETRSNRARLERATGGEPGRFGNQAATQEGGSDTMLKKLFGLGKSSRAAEDAGAAEESEEQEKTKDETTETAETADGSGAAPGEQAAEQAEESATESGAEAASPEAAFLGLVDLIGPDAAAAAMKAGLSREEALAAEVKRLQARDREREAILKQSGALGEESPADVTAEDALQRGGDKSSLLGDNLSRVAAHFGRQLKRR